MSLRQTVALSFLFVGREDPMIPLRKGWGTVGLVRPHFALGRASSVHFLHFPFPDHLIAKFHEADVSILLGIGHENYAHMTILSKETITSLGGDFDAV